MLRLTIAFVLVAAVAVGVFFTFVDKQNSGKLSNLADNLTSNQDYSKEEIEQIIEAYILDNPQVILESVENQQKRAQEERLQKAKNNIGKYLNELESTKDAPFTGNKDADVTIVEFFDYACGYCKRVLPDLTAIVKEDTGVKIVFREFPILGPKSEMISRFAVAAYLLQPDSYFRFHSKLMSTRISGEDSILKAAADIGIDAGPLKEKSKSPEVAAMIARNRELAGEIGIQGTPAFLVGGELVPGAIGKEKFQQLVNNARQKTQ